MAYKGSRSDLITGAFALVVVASVVGVIMFLQTIQPKIEGDQYTVTFEDVGGLGSRSAVIVAGQKVGRVDGIDTLPVVSSDGAQKVEVIVKFVIDEEFADTVVLPVDTVAEVQMGSIFGFGGNQIVLKLGDSRDVVQPGQRLPLKGRPPVNINEVMQTAADAVKEMNEGITAISGILKDEEFNKDITESLSHLNSALTKIDEGLEELKPAFGNVNPTLESAQELLAEIKAIIQKNDEAITETIVSLKNMSGSLEVLMQVPLLDENGQPVLDQNGNPVQPKGEVLQLVASLNTIASNMDTLVSSLNDVVLDNQLNIEISLANVRESTESLRVFARRIERDPSLLIWGTEDEPEDPKTAPPKGTPNVDELAIRNSGRRPRKESD